MKKAKKLFGMLFIMVALVCVMTLSASALEATGQCGDNVYWNFNESTGELVISGEGPMWNQSSLFNGSNIKSVVIENDITDIGSYTFSNCAYLTSVTIPDTITAISPYSFKACTSLTSIIIPDSITTIGEGAFSDCTHLENIITTDSIIRIFDGAFYNTAYYNNDSNWKDDVLYIGNYLIKAKNSLLGTYKVKENTICIAYYAFSNCQKLKNIIIANSVKNIGVGAFYSCTSLKKINIPNSVRYIDYESFYNCANLTSVTISDNVTTIYSKAFEKCVSLTNITIPDSVTSIGSEAFKSCTSLTCITIPNSITSIGNSAFHSCINLKDITFPDSVTSIGSGVVSNTAYYNDDLNWENNVLYIGNHLITEKEHLSGEYIIKSGTISIAGSAFSYTKLEKIIIPTTVKNIGEYAFYESKKLINATIPDGVCTVGSYAFYNCTNLVTITMPDSVKEIGFNAFTGSGYYNDSSNWENDMLYIGNHLIKVQTSSEDSCDIKDDTLTIANYAFFGYEKLNHIVVPKSVKAIGSLAFSGCSGLTDVYYNGTILEFLSINIEESGNDNLFSATIHCDKNSKHFYDYYTKIAIEANKDSFDDATTFVVTENGISKNHIFSRKYDLYNSYDINFVDTEKNNVQPNGYVTVMLFVPENYNPETTRVYYVDDNGNIEKLDSKYENSYIIFETNHFSEYVLVDESMLHSHSFINYVSNNDATCIIYGTKTATCDGCSTTETITDYNSLKEHVFTDYISDSNATCTKDGTKTAKCDNCFETKTVTDLGSRKGHSFTNYISDDNATCTKDGTKTAKCDNCTETKTVTDLDSRKGHSFTNYISDNNATCTKNGTKTAKCDNNCGLTDTVTDYGSATGHSYEEVIYNPTCTENGYIEYTCHCGRHYTETIEATGHDFEGSKCKNCSYDKATECSCNCHAGGIKTFFFNFINFFQKLFGQNKVCACGAKH